MRRAVVLLLLTACNGPGTGAPDQPIHDGKGDVASGASIRDRLSHLPGVASVQLLTSGEGCAELSLRFEQPVDHDAPSGDHFLQRVDVHHCDTAAPTIFMPDGYALDLDAFTSELTTMLRANQIAVEHRYFAGSTPGDAPASHLDIRQAALDHHAIVRSLRTLYDQGAWISTGASKGGMTSVYHRRFFPDDVDGTVAYVAPFMIGQADPRFPPFFDQVGNDACRLRMRGAQRAMLLHRAELEQRMADDTSRTYHQLGVDIGFESAVTLFSWYFWSYGGNCDALPLADAPAAALWSTLSASGGLDYSSDEEVDTFLPFIIQSVRQLGWPARAQQGLTDLLQHAPLEETQGRLEGRDGTWDAQAMQEVRDFVAHDAHRILFIYGAEDPWTIGQAELGDGATGRELAKFFAPHNNHGSQISDLSATDREAALDLIARWARSADKLYALPLTLDQRERELRHRADLLPLPRARRAASQKGSSE